MRTIRELVEVYHNGDKMTDDELIAFNKHMSTVSSVLDELGPEYRIHANHARDITRITGEYIVARGIATGITNLTPTVSLHQLIAAGAFHIEDESEPGGVVADGFVVRDGYDQKIEGWAMVGKEFYVQYRTTDASVDPDDERCFVIFKVEEAA